VNLIDAVESMRKKFSSANSIAVERATITREEWEAIQFALMVKPEFWPKDFEQGAGWPTPGSAK